MAVIFVNDIEDITLDNEYYRKVIYTTKDKNMQLVIMSLKPEEEIGMEVHKNVDQFFRIEKGSGVVVYGINKKTKNIKENDVIIIPAGIYHNIINTDKHTELKLYTIYTPANHPDKKKEKNKPKNK